MFLWFIVISCDESEVLNSIATLTTMSIPVAVNALRSPREPPATSSNKIFGTTVKNARNRAPKNVILFDTLDKYSTVGFPGLIAGIDPPAFFKLSAISFGLNTTEV